MARDRREEFLTHLETVTLPAIAAVLTAALGKSVFVYRDRGDIEPINPETQAPQLPALILLDGKENPHIDTKSRGRPGALSPTVMRAEPQVYIALMPRTTTANEGVGPELSQFRAQVIKILGTDQALWVILGSNGDITYDGMDTDMHANGPLVGQEAMKFSLYYSFIPQEL